MIVLGGSGDVLSSLMGKYFDIPSTYAASVELTLSYILSPPRLERILVQQQQRPQQQQQQQQQQQEGNTVTTSTTQYSNTISNTSQESFTLYTLLNKLTQHIIIGLFTNNICITNTTQSTSSSAPINRYPYGIIEIITIQNILINKYLQLILYTNTATSIHTKSLIKKELSNIYTKIYANHNLNITEKCQNYDLLSDETRYMWEAHIDMLSNVISEGKPFMNSIRIPDGPPI